MKKSSIIVAIIWLYSVGISVLQGFTLPTSQIAHGIPIPWQILVCLPLIIVIGAFFNKEIPGSFLIGRSIDQRFGQGTYRSFMISLKPELLFSCMCFGIGIVGFLRTFQLGGPSGAFSMSGFFISGGLAFFAAHVISRRFRVYDKPPATPQSMSYSPVAMEIFWKETKKRRNILFAVFFGWLVAGPILVTIYSLIFPGMPKNIIAISALLTWAVVILWAQIRFKQLRCFRCGEQAFSNPLFFMKDAKCRNCGVTLEIS